MIDMSWLVITGFTTVVIIYYIAIFTLFIVTTVFFCKWVHRACTNAHGFSNAMTITPNWAVGWYFIPVAALFMPYKAMAEIWNASAPQGAGRGVLVTWWSLFITIIAAATISIIIQYVWGGQAYVLTSCIDVLNEFITIAQSIFAIKLVKCVTKFQEEKINGDSVKAS